MNLWEEEKVKQRVESVIVTEKEIGEGEKEKEGGERGKKRVDCAERKRKEGEKARRKRKRRIARNFQQSRHAIS